MKADRIEVTNKMREALMWGLAQIGDRPRRRVEGPADPLHTLLEKYQRAHVMLTCRGMWPRLFPPVLAAPLNEIEADILKACVEQTSWVTSYVRNPLLSRKDEDEARATLRELARRLEAFGIEINTFPSD